MTESDTTKLPYIHKNALVETSEIGPGSRVWAFAHVMPDAKIGANCNIGDHSFVESKVTIGDNVTIKNGVSVWQHVHIGDNVFVGPNAVFTNDLFPRSRDAHWEPVETWLEEGVTIGANATIVCGVRLGKRCLIGAGAVVTRDVPPHAVVVGNPARRSGWVCYCGTVLPSPNTTASCSRCGRSYRVTDDGVEESR